MKKLLFALVFLALVGFGVWRWWDRLDPQATRPADGSGESVVSRSADRPVSRIEGLVETQTEVVSGRSKPAS